MLKFFILSIVIVPCLIGISAARRNERKGDPAALRIRWIIYITVWFGLLYFAKRKWAG